MVLGGGGGGGHKGGKMRQLCYLSPLHDIIYHNSACRDMSQQHVTRVKREFREIITSEEVSLASELQKGGAAPRAPWESMPISFLLLTFASPLSVGSSGCGQPDHVRVMSD